jgi:hypothetical protein
MRSISGLIRRAWASVVLVAIVATFVFAQGTPQPSVGLYWEFNGNPTTGAGVCAPQWQLLFRTDNNTLYYKSGTACTAWTPFAGSGAGTVSSITCLTGLTCTPNPIVATGTIAADGSSPTGTGTANTITKWLTTTTIGNAGVTDNGTTVATSENIQANAALGTVGVTPGAISVPTGTVGIGSGFNPGTYLDVRHNRTPGWDDAEFVAASTTTSIGVSVDMVRSLGTIAAPTSTDWTNQLGTFFFWGYTTANTVALGSELKATVDQHNTSTVVPANIEIWNTSLAGVYQASFRVDSAQHVTSLAATTPVLTSCGTGAAFLNGQGTDVVGTITEGTGATGCTLTFTVSWSQVFNGQIADCTVYSSSGYILQPTTSATALTIVNVGPASSTNIVYHCFGGQAP